MQTLYVLYNISSPTDGENKDALIDHMYVELLPTSMRMCIACFCLDLCVSLRGGVGRSCAVASKCLSILIGCAVCHLGRAIMQGIRSCLDVAETFMKVPAMLCLLNLATVRRELSSHAHTHAPSGHACIVLHMLPHAGAVYLTAERGSIMRCVCACVCVHAGG